MYFIFKVEFYFSDANILKDAFLLKHVRLNKQGYVSLKLITSFKKVKTLTKDFRVVAYSLRQSDKLEINEDGNKVRRIEPLPEYDETTPSRTVVAVNLPIENPTIETVAELFSKCGDIALIRILRPGKSVPQDVKKHINKHPEIGTTVCAVVEFEAHESAKKACDTMTNTDDWRRGLRVVLLSLKKEKEKDGKKGKKEKNKEKPDQSGDASAKSAGEEGEFEEKKPRKKKNNRRKNSRVEEIQAESPYYSSSSDVDSVDTTPVRPHRADALGPSPNRKRTDSGGYDQSPSRGRSDSGPRIQRSSLSPKPESGKLLSPGGTPRSSPSNSPRGSPRGSPTARRKHHHGKSPLAQELSPGTSPRHSPRASPEMRRRKDSRESGGETGSSPSSPWVQRRLKAAQERSPLAGSSPGASPLMGRRMAGMEGVLREPRGPDGTKGFYGGLGRGKPIAEEGTAV